MLSAKGHVDTPFHDEINDIPDCKLGHTTEQNHQMNKPLFPLFDNNPFPNDILDVQQRKYIQQLSAEQSRVVPERFDLECLRQFVGIINANKQHFQEGTHDVVLFPVLKVGSDEDLLAV
jgi:hypothetical protein